MRLAGGIPRRRNDTPAAKSGNFTVTWSFSAPMAPLFLHEIRRFFGPFRRFRRFLSGTHSDRLVAFCLWRHRQEALSDALESSIKPLKPA